MNGVPVVGDKYRVPVKIHPADMSTTRVLRHTLQIVSDIHLDARAMSRSFVIERKAPTLAVLGDVDAIGSKRLVRFFNNVCARFERVYFVPGNHEYYATAPKSALARNLHELARQWSNLCVLDRGTCDRFAPGYRVLGCTLWSHIDNPCDEHVRSTLHEYMNDYRYIRREYGVLATVDDTHAWHLGDVLWLESELKRARSDGVRTIVLTHHAPLVEGTSNPKYEVRSGSEALLNQAFRSDLSHLFRAYAPDTWAFGHTHWRTAFTYDRTRVRSNPVGYDGEYVGETSAAAAETLYFDAV